ncbi:MAG TPA: DEAD/DEAH box helicase family protein [Candidatus Baltobacteraceae bacterium]|jgi:superfamily II DNA or RNA helicase
MELLSAWRLPLRTWQREAFETWWADRPATALIVATPGAGKTRFAARLAHALLQAGDVRRVVAVVPREHLKGQITAAMAGAGIHLDSNFDNATGSISSDMHGAAVTYQQVAFSPQIYRSIGRVPTLVILDEVHHAGDQATWGQALRDAFGGTRYRVGMSGTPFRSDGTPIPFVRYHHGLSQADYTYDYTHALRDGVCRPLVFPLQGGYAEWISKDGELLQASFDTALRSRAQQGERLRTALTQNAWLGDVIAKADEKLREIRRDGHGDAGGLIVAMNQQHARFVADLVRERVGIEPAIVLSDEDGASRRISKFARSRDPWIVAVHMISEGVDIPRLRVGIFASNVNTEMYFRQFCGRFVRTQRLEGTQHAFVYLPDDARLRELASRVTIDVKAFLKGQREFDELALANRTIPAPGETLSQFRSINAVVQEERVLDYGPLFNPAAYAVEEQAPQVTDAAEPDFVLSKAEEKELLRRSLQGLVAQASQRFAVEHRKIHATLNARFGGPIAAATTESLKERRHTVLRWLERGRYDGL